MQESTELQELIIDCFRAVANGDGEFFERHVLRSAELRLIGATSEDWFGGVEGFEMLRQQAVDGRGDLRAAAEQVEAYSSGDAGWGAAVIRYAYGTDQVVMARETFVFHRVEQTWKLVQSHTSFPVSAAAVFS